MGYRFYMQQLEALGTCPGYNSTTKRKRKMAWDDDKKAAVIAAYEEQNPTPENSMEIVKEIADEYEESPNGVRMILSKAGVYVKKTPAATGSVRPQVVVAEYQKQQRKKHLCQHLQMSVQRLIAI